MKKLVKKTQTEVEHPLSQSGRKRSVLHIPSDSAVTGRNIINWLDQEQHNFNAENHQTFLGRNMRPTGRAHRTTLPLPLHRGTLNNNKPTITREGSNDNRAIITNIIRRPDNRVGTPLMNRRQLIGVLCRHLPRHHRRSNNEHPLSWPCHRGQTSRP